MAQAALHYDDLIGRATLTASSSSGEMTVDKLKHYQPKRMWRGDTETEQLIADFGSTQFCPASFLFRHNLSAQATIRIRLSDNADLSSPRFDATFYAWPSLLGYDQEVYDGTRFIGYDNAPVTENLPPELFQTSFIHSDTGAALEVLADDGSYAGRYLAYDIADPGTLTGYVQAGIWRAGPLLKPTFDINADPEFGFDDPSVRIAAYGQELWVTGKAKSRSERFGYGYLSEQEALTEMFFLSSIAGASRPVIYLPYTENSFRSVIRTIYGLLDAPARPRQVRRRADHFSYAVDLTIRALP